MTQIDFSTISVTARDKDAITSDLGPLEHPGEVILILLWRSLVTELGKIPRTFATEHLEKLLTFKGSLSDFLALCRCTFDEFKQLYELWQGPIIIKSDTALTDEQIKIALNRSKVLNLITQITHRSKSLVYVEPLPPVKTAPPIFTSNTEKIPTSLPYNFSLKAQMGGIDEWVDKYGAACHEAQTKGVIRHFIRDFGSQETRAIPLKDALTIIHNFGLDTAKLHLIFGIYACKNKEPWKTVSEIKATDLIPHLGLPRDWTLQQKFEYIGKCARTLSSLMIELDITITSKGKPQSISVQKSPVWAVTNVQNYYYPSDTLRENPYECIISLIPGGWSKYFLNPEIANHYGYLSEILLSTPIYNNEIALKIAMAQVVNWTKTAPKEVREWLFEAGLAPSDLNSIAKDRRKKQKLKHKWDSNVIPTLQQMGFTLSLDPETYTEDLKPDYKGKMTHGYFSRWLEAKIAITRPPFEKPQLEPISPPTVIKPVALSAPLKVDTPRPITITVDPIASDSDLIKQIIELREQTPFSKREISIAASRSPNFLTKLEGGKIKKITPELVEEIKKAIQKLYKCSGTET